MKILIFRERLCRAPYYWFGWEKFSVTTDETIFIAMILLYVLYIWRVHSQRNMIIFSILDDIAQSLTHSRLQHSHTRIDGPAQHAFGHHRLFNINTSRERSRNVLTNREREMLSIQTDRNLFIFSCTLYFTRRSHWTWMHNFWLPMTMCVCVCYIYDVLTRKLESIKRNC